MAEQRVAARQKTFIKAEISLHGPSRLPCVVRDLSDAGACLDLSSEILLPDPFSLYLPKFDRWMTANVRWRRGNHVGISMKVMEVGSEQRFPEEQKLGELEHEIARLRQLLELMRGETGMLGATVRAVA